jgi:hypothetical protein
MWEPPRLTTLWAFMACYKDKDSQGVIKFRQNLFKQEVKYYTLKIHELINSIWNKEKLPDL